MYRASANAVLSAVRMLFHKWTTLPLMLLTYGALLLAVYLFVSTREATVSQLVLTFAVMLAAPLFFFALQAASVNYAIGSSGLLRKTLRDSLKFIAVSLPVIASTLLAVYVVGKLQVRITSDANTSSNALTTLTVMRYLLIGVVAPLVTIQLWIATSRRGVRELRRGLRETIARAFAPEAVLVFAFGFLVFAVAPYFLLTQPIPMQRGWLEVSVFTARVVGSALLVMIGWVVTVGALSILTTRSNEPAVTQMDLGQKSLEPLEN